MDRGIRFLAIFFTVVLPANASENQSFSDAHAAFGRKSAVQYDMGAVSTPADGTSSADTNASTSSVSTPATGDSSTGLYAVLSAMLLGKDRSILEAQASVTNDLEGESDFYWGGFRVWSTKPEWKEGAFQYSVGLPSVSMRAPIVGVPVGPLTLRVDAGVAAEAAVTAALRPLISIPIQYTSIKAELKPVAAASGFLEAYAQFIAIRGGVGGSVEFIRANASLAGTIGFGTFKPVFDFSGFISLLSGKIYAFADYFNIFGWKWHRFWQPTIADWKGKCIGLSKTDGGSDPCAATTP